MTNIDFFLEEVNTNRFTSEEYNEYQKKLKLPSLTKMIKDGYVKLNRLSNDSDIFYSIAIPIKVWSGNFPLSRMESFSYGANYRFPLRIEQALYEELKNQNINIQEVKKWFWSSPSARHFADNYDGDWYKWDTKEKFIKYLQNYPEIIKSIKTNIQEFKKIDNGIGESYHQSNLKTTLAKFMGNKIRSFNLDIGSFLLNNAKNCLLIIFEEYERFKFYF